MELSTSSRQDRRSSGSGQRVYEDCRNFRESYGDRYRGNSPSLRDSWQSESGIEAAARLATMAPVEGQRFWQECRRIDSGDLASWLVDPAASAAPVSAEEVAHRALAEVSLELPDVQTSPPRGGESILVGPPVWFWVDDPQSETVSAEVPGLSATLTAEPVSLRVEATPLGSTGRAESFECTGTGEAWQRDRHGPWDASPCSISFDWNDSYQIDATVVWELTWTASNGESGALADVERTTSFTMRVYQAQAVTD